ncbi:MAG: transglutaminase-like cysteine peptidase [Methylobacteriaceae bacterium]|nr:transglutaminase-like cysteine peptidase [Methylobacteriaceae bacterium]
MLRFLTKALIASALLTGGFIAAHASNAAGVMQSTFAPVGGPTSVPYGWVDFCQRYRGECEAPELPATDVNLTPQTMKEIERVNHWVNSNITPMSDMEHWGVVDQWDYPTDGKGDCEDYALLKRKLLIEEGLPRQALLMTVVKDLNNDGHAVLTVKTNRGDFILDNMREDVRPWTQTGYRFVKRQSQTNENVWVSIGAPTDAPAYVSR